LFLSLAACLFSSAQESPRGISVEARELAGNSGLLNYHLLCIGIDEYQQWRPLQCAVRDAQAVAEVLKTDYGFQLDPANLLLDQAATQEAILSRLRELTKTLTEHDALLIYYAGHGDVDPVTGKGSWIPVDAAQESDSRWIFNQRVKDYLEAMKARHVFLISDSCFSGDFFRGREALPAMADDYLRNAYPKRARVALSSGALEPVMDGGREGHSWFAWWLLQKLRTNSQPVIAARRLSEEVFGGVVANLQQQPIYGMLHGTGGEVGGDFVLVRRTPANPLDPQIRRDSYADVISRVTPAIVGISVKLKPDPEMEELLKDPLMRRMFPNPETFNVRDGSGVVISPDGYILTAYQLIGNAESLAVQIKTLNLELPAKLWAADQKTNLAILKVDRTGLPAIPIGDSSLLRVGDLCFQVAGSGGKDHTVIMTNISTVHVTKAQVGIPMEFVNLLLTGTPVSPSNVGGALVDTEGKLIGLNIAVVRKDARLDVGYSIPINFAMDIKNRLESGGGIVRRGYLGAAIKEVDPALAEGLAWKEDYGVIIDSVLPAGAAAKAGLKVNDVITEFQGRRVERDVAAFCFAIAHTDPRDEVELKIFRNGKELTITVTLGENTPFLEGVEITNLTDGDRAENSIDASLAGVLVKSVSPNSAAAEAGLNKGMVITEVNRQKVTNEAEAMTVKQEFDGRVIILRVSAAGKTSLLAVRVKE